LVIPPSPPFQGGNRKGKKSPASHRWFPNLVS